MNKKIFILFFVLFLFFTLATIIYAQPFEEEFPTEENGNEGASESRCYLWYDNIDGVNKCTSSPPSTSRASSYGANTGCECVNNNPILTSCASTASEYILHTTDGGSQRFVLVSRITNSFVGVPTECNLCSERKIIVPSGDRGLCEGVQDNCEESAISEIAGLASICQYNYENACWTTDEERLVYYDDGRPFTRYIDHARPCCLDQDQDGHGIEEYSGAYCGSVEFGDCWDGPQNIVQEGDEEQREIAGQVWRGCTRAIRNLELSLTEEIQRKMQENNVNFWYMESQSSDFQIKVGKSEKCNQTDDWNADGVAPRNSWQCRLSREPTGNWEEPSHPNNFEYEYPLRGRMYVDGNEVTCSFISDNEATKWGDLKLNEQKFKIKLEEKLEPQDEWGSYDSETTDLADRSCDDGGCCNLANPEIIPEGMSEEEYLREHREPFNCKADFKIDAGLRGHQIRCFVYPFNDGETDYWKAKNASTADAIVAKKSIVVLPADVKTKALNFNIFFYDDTKPFVIKEKIRRTISINDELDGGINLPGGTIKEESDAYYYVYSDTNSKLYFSEKSVFVEEQIPIRNIVFFNELDAIIKDSDIPSPKQLRSRGVPLGETIFINLEGNVFDIEQFAPFDIINVQQNLNSWEYDYRPMLDTIVLQYLRSGLAYSGIIKFELEGYNYNLAFKNVRFTFEKNGLAKKSVILIKELTDLWTLSHELGHRKRHLCDEYKIELWLREENFYGACPNPFPLCCIGTGNVNITNQQRGLILRGSVQNSCGEEDSCPGMRYYPDENGHDVPDPLGTKPAGWRWISIMGPDNNYDLPKIYPSASNYQGTDHCPLRKWPDQPPPDRTCQGE